MNIRWLLLVFFIVGGVQADVTRTVKTSSYLVIGESEVTSVDCYANDRSTAESTTKWLGGVMKTVKGKKPIQSISITRLDKEIVWTLNPKKETYTQMTFAEFREQMEKGMAETEETEIEEVEEVDETSEAENEDEYEWTLEVLSDPEPKIINGWECRNVKLMATGTHKEEPRDKVWITIDQWNSPDVPGMQEITDYNTRYMKALGVDELALTPGLMDVAAAYQNQFSALFEETKEAPGESVLNSIEIKVNQQVGPTAKERAADAATDELTKKLPFGLKKKKKKEPRWEEKVKFQSTTELVEVSLDPVDKSRFEVPEGYKKK